MIKVLLMAMFLLTFLGGSANANDNIVIGYAGEGLEINGEVAGYNEQVWEQEPYQLRLARDDEKLFVHLKVKAEGWISIGFNELGRGMDGANMFLGYFDGGEGFLRNDAGSGRTHSAVEDSILGDFFISRENEFTVIEFSYPLQFPEDQGFNLPGLNPEDKITVILAYHNTSDNPRIRHSGRTAVNAIIK